MQTKSLFALFALLQCNLFRLASGSCETEDDLDFETCDLEDLTDDVLTGICDRIGLDMAEVMPYLLEGEAGEGEANSDGDKEADAAAKTYTHAEYAQGAEECLAIEDEMDQMEHDDPEYLEQLERDAIADDPEAIAEIIAQVLEQDDALLKEIARKIEKDKPLLVVEVEGLLGIDDKLEDRADVVGFIIAKMLAGDGDLDILDEFDDALSDSYDAIADHFHEEDWDDEEVGAGDGDEL